MFCQVLPRGGLWCTSAPIIEVRRLPLLLDGPQLGCHCVHKSSQRAALSDTRSSQSAQNGPARLALQVQISLSLRERLTDACISKPEQSLLEHITPIQRVIPRVKMSPLNHTNTFLEKSCPATRPFATTYLSVIYEYCTTTEIGKQVPSIMKVCINYMICYYNQQVLVTTVNIISLMMTFIIGCIFLL